MKYSDKAIWMVAGLVILFSVIWHTTYNNRQHKVDLGKCRFVVEIAKTNKKRELGLVERDALCQRCGMLFEFSKKARYKFFMKGMRFPIDIVWIADDNIVGIERNISEKSIKTLDWKGYGENMRQLQKVLLELAGRKDRLSE